MSTSKRPMAAVPEAELWDAITNATSAAIAYRGQGPTVHGIARRLSAPGYAVATAELEARLGTLYADGLLAHRSTGGTVHWRITSAGQAHAQALRDRDLTDAEAWPAIAAHLSERATSGRHADVISPAAIARSLAIQTRQVLAWLTCQATAGLVVQSTLHDRPVWAITPAGRDRTIQTVHAVSA
ncbi:hypothetical protein MXD62_16595 [Frankia sp. Mgl5]|uniref:hypothetical protein n=1 Tax=Frankia sp. Mgl5 TaxID=2933793 RepID=UPI00200EC67B|nr:hypothetical protein [Frankia sp. Mgl5]MCK9928775.1 hypothetical protein [Frankia sp. Mgl5]